MENFFSGGDPLSTTAETSYTMASQSPLLAPILMVRVSYLISRLKQCFAC